MAEDQHCGLPLATQAERLAEQLRPHLGDGFMVHITDLYDLQGADKDAALDAIGAGELSPFVLVEGVVASAGSLDAYAVLKALGRS
jgi:hypothetical protein